MTKLFKTISLEERLKGSSYNELPLKPGSVNQGSTSIKLPTTTKDLESIQLKLTINAQEKNSAILKSYLKTKTALSLPSIGQFNTTPISKLAIPFVNTSFRTFINLADRLSQPNLGTTKHLPQFFLADFYTGYIKVNPFGIFNHTSDVTIVLPQTTIPQGGLNPSTIQFTPNHTSTIQPIIPIADYIASQGTVFSNGMYSSVSSILYPTSNIILQQGVMISNGVYQSMVSPTLSISPNTINQGSGVTPTNSVSVQSMYLLQGLILNMFNQLTSPIVTQTPANIVLSVPSSIVIQQPIATPAQGGIDPTPITFTPDRSSPVLRVLAYEAQRALAFFTPRIIHGSATLRTRDFNSSYTPNQGQADLKEPPYKGYFDAFVAPYVSPLLRNELSETQAQDVLLGYIDWQYDYVKPALYDNNKKAARYLSIEYVKIGGDLASNPNTAPAKALGASTSTDDLSNYVDNNVAFPKAAAPDGQGSLAEYKTLTYGQIANRAQQSVPNNIQGDFRVLIVTPQDVEDKRIIDGTTGKAPVDRGVSSYVDNRSGYTNGLVNNSDAPNDLVTLKIASLVGGGSESFRAFITTFSDSFNVSWNDLNYVGRQDTLKTFKGVTRGGSIAFKIAAFNPTDLANHYRKLNNLTKIAAVGRGSGNTNYIIAPFCAITVGKWFNNTPCVFNSIKYDVQMADYSWDLDKQVPQIVDVSLDFALLGDVNGTPLNANANNYFNYRG